MPQARWQTVAGVLHELLMMHAVVGCSQPVRSSFNFEFARVVNDDVCSCTHGNRFAGCLGQDLNASTPTVPVTLNTCQAQHAPPSSDGRGSRFLWHGVFPQTCLHLVIQLPVHNFSFVGIICTRCVARTSRLSARIFCHSPSRLVSCSSCFMSVLLIRWLWSGHSEPQW